MTKAIVRKGNGEGARSSRGTGCGRTKNPKLRPVVSMRARKGAVLERGRGAWERGRGVMGCLRSTVMFFRRLVTFYKHGQKGFAGIPKGFLPRIISCQLSDSDDLEIKLKLSPNGMQRGLVKILQFF